MRKTEMHKVNTAMNLREFPVEEFGCVLFCLKEFVLPLPRINSA